MTKEKIESIKDSILAFDNGYGLTQLNEDILDCINYLQKELEEAENYIEELESTGERQ